MSTTVALSRAECAWLTMVLGAGVFYLDCVVGTLLTGVEFFCEFSGRKKLRNLRENWVVGRTSHGLENFLASL